MSTYGFPEGLRQLSVLLPLLFLSACAGSLRTELAVPEVQVNAFAPIGVTGDVRMFADEFDGDANQLVAEYRAILRQFPDSSDGLDILALSGGGPDGAFGAGVLAGWTTSGTRPEFDIVTGISTGAIIAPFAFLGPDYDDELRRFYTEIETRQIVRFNVVGALFGGGGFGNTAPLAATIERELTDDLIAQIAIEAAKGRSLLVGTTNLDAERPVIWDIGAMAMQGTPEANALIRRVILASASIPVLFEPVAIPVSNGQGIREELHVDGGLTNQVFVYPVDLPMRQMLRELGYANRDNNVWLIQNKALWPEYDTQSLSLSSLAGRTLEILIKSQTMGDIAEIIAVANRDGFELNALTIPEEFDIQKSELFDPNYMRALYEVGFRTGATSTSWFRNLESVLR